MSIYNPEWSRSVPSHEIVFRQGTLPGGREQGVCRCGLLLHGSTRGRGRESLAVALAKHIRDSAPDGNL